MPRFEPFSALRYAASGLDDLIAPPYDVLSDADLDELEQRHEHNIVRVDVPREHDGPGRYEAAAAALQAWVTNGVLVRDAAPTFTTYRMRFVDTSGTPRSIAGVLGALEVVDEGAGGVLPHERTTPKASTDRLDLTRATRANLSPVWGLSLASGLTRLLDEPGEHLASVTVDGVTHVVERVTDADRVAAITACVGSDDVLIADGHHRYGVARAYRDEERAAGRGGGAAETTLTFVNELVADQLSVAAIHRLYRGTSFGHLREVLERSFELVDHGPVGGHTLAELDRRGALCLVGPDGSGTLLVPRPGVFEGVRSLDGLWLEQALAEAGVEVAYQHGVDHVAAAVRGGDVVAGVLIRPVPVDEIVRTAREGLLMPPKSTFFTPKLRTGLVVRPLDD